MQDRAGFDGLEAAPALGLFAMSHLAYEIDRDASEQPSLAEMTRKAIELLDAEDGEGFFLMVEGSRIDHAGHANDAAAHLHDILAFDEAVAVALEFAEADGATLLVSTSDHETGGLTLGRTVNGRGLYAWYPEVLERVQHSHEYMGDRLREGTSMGQIKSMLGIEDFSEEETATILAGFESGDGSAVMQAFTEAIGRRAVLGWTTSGHTGVDVKLFAYGPGASQFIGNHDNTAIGTVLAGIMGFDLAELTAILRTN